MCTTVQHVPCCTQGHAYVLSKCLKGALHFEFVKMSTQVGHVKTVEVTRAVWLPTLPFYSL